MSEQWFSSSLLLYSSYFLFFSPYLFRLISFLSPLVLTTSLLLLFTPQCPPHFKLDFIFLAGQSYETTHPPFEEAFRVIFGDSDDYEHIELRPPLDDEERVVEVITEDNAYDVKPALEQREKMKPENFTKELDKEEDTTEMVSHTNSKECPPPPISKVKAISQRFDAKPGEFSPSSRTLSNISSCGSIRRDKEWKRTLACKLFEERHNNSAQGVRKGEGMDLLWETYDAEPTKSSRASSKKNSFRPKEEDEDEDEEDMEGGGGGELCCLQALKFSGGKMNLGMKKPSLVKISKAIKGIRWLKHLTTINKSKNGHL